MRYKVDDTFPINIAYEDGSGTPTDPTGDAAYTVYKDNVLMDGVAGNLAKINSVTGFYGADIELTEANGFAVDCNYVVRIVATIDGQTVTKLERFSITSSVVTEYDEDTTCNICAVAQVKQRLGLTDTDTDSDIDETIALIIAGFEAFAETFCERKLFRPDADVTEYKTGRGDYVRLDYYPIISITSIKEAYDYDFDNADALVANTDYRIINSGKKGILKRLYISWPDIDDSIQVVYKGGFTPIGEAVAAGETALPQDIIEAAVMQCSFTYKRKDDIGLTAVSFDAGSIQKFSAMDLLPLVKDTLTKYKRVSV